MTEQSLDSEIMFEEEVLERLAAHLEDQDWRVGKIAKATEHGVDLSARRDDVRLMVEAKGEGSSKDHTSRFGQAFSRGQVNDHVAKAVLTAMAVVSARDGLAAVAFPDNTHHRDAVAKIQVALDELGITVFMVGRDGVQTTGPDRTRGWVPGTLASDYDGIKHLVALTDDVEGWQVLARDGKPGPGPQPFPGGYYPELNGLPSWDIDLFDSDWALQVDGINVSIRGSNAG